MEEELPNTYERLSDCYESEELRAGYDQLRTAFRKRFGRDPERFARAPGRVNLIGEHIDYSGFSVLPFALAQDTVIAFSALPEDRLVIANVDERFEVYEQAAAAPIVIDKSRLLWYNYVLAGLEASGRTRTGLALLVAGRVPIGAGVSSSSALVCASSLCGGPAPRAVLAERCQASERLVGLEGGGMDQAISFLAQPAAAKLISFNPLRSETVPLPAGLCYVVANTLVAANKYHSQYNVRVAECRAAALLLGRALGRPGQTLGQVAGLGEAGWEARLPALEAAAAQLPERLTAAEVGALGLAAPAPELLVRARAQHVYAEAARVLTYAAACRAGDVAALGPLLDASHASCANLYACSCPELDELAARARAAGALGARLTGAGWGGCIIAVVAEARLPALLAALRAYYQPPPATPEHTYLFVTRPGPAASYVAASAT